MVDRKGGQIPRRGARNWSALSGLIVTLLVGTFTRKREKPLPFWFVGFVSWGCWLVILFFMLALTPHAGDLIEVVPSPIPSSKPMASADLPLAANGHTYFTFKRHIKSTPRFQGVRFFYQYPHGLPLFYCPSIRSNPTLQLIRLCGSQTRAPRKEVQTN